MALTARIRFLERRSNGCTWVTISRPFCLRPMTNSSPGAAFDFAFDDLRRCELDGSGGDWEEEERGTRVELDGAAAAAAAAAADSCWSIFEQSQFAPSSTYNSVAARTCTRGKTK